MSRTFAFKCRSCGATMQIDPDRLNSYCPFCGDPLPNANELLKIVLQNEDNKDYRKYDLEKKKKEQSHDRFLLVMTVVLSLIFITPIFIILMQAISMW